ncbi:MAG TPA: MFS transporter [Gemmataceae bacterium]|nr:MFS transporter [Gemmataceae bacterium]
MQFRGFLKTGHTPTLLCAFLYFDISFMVWVLLGALANSIVPDFGLNEAQRGLMLAIPLLSGSLLRPVLGVMTDRIGARRTGILGLVLTLVPLLVGWLWTDSYVVLLLVGLMLGVAGASFAAALPLASRWYPPQYQGMAMGIAGAGNSGTVLATLFGPMLAAAFGWHHVFALALIPILLTLVLFVLFARDSPSQPPAKHLKDYAAVLAMRDTWWFCLFYSATFGGFVGLAVFLNSFFKVQYGLTAVEAGYFATACVISGSFLRPVGGYLADCFGGVRILAALYLGVAVLMLGVAALPPLAVGTTLLFLVMGLLGVGNGSVFQLVPQRFPKEIGVMTGIVGAAGGIGGFFLPNLLGSIKQLTGTFSYAFVIFAAFAVVCAAALVHVSRSWEGVFLAKGGLVVMPVPEPEPALVPNLSEPVA